MTTSMVLLASRSWGVALVSVHLTGSPRARRGVVAEVKETKSKKKAYRPTYLKSLTNAEDNAEATVNGGLDLAGNELDGALD